VYDWELGKAPAKRPDPIRTPKLGDEGGYFDSKLTPNGRHYLWRGPRRGQWTSRCEVIEVATGKLRRTFPEDGGSFKVEISATLTPDGRTLYAETEEKKVLAVDVETATLLPGPGYHPFFSEDMKWMISASRPADLRWYEVLPLCRTAIEPSCLEFFNYDSSPPRPWAIYRDGHYLAWADESAAITVADVHALQSAVSEFEKSALPK
jgi:hypothetical protein